MKQVLYAASEIDRIKIIMVKLQRVTIMDGCKRILTAYKLGIVSFQNHNTT
jgi:hypothetical protein